MEFSLAQSVEDSGSCPHPGTGDSCRKYFCEGRQKYTLEDEKVNK